MKLGCHCVLYGKQIAEDTDQVLSLLKTAGAQGCEIGERFFGADQAEKLKIALDAHEIELSGMHCNGMKWMDLIFNPQKAENAVLGVAKALAGMKNRNIIATGGVDIERLNDRLLTEGAGEEELHNPENIRIGAENLEKIAKKARELYGAQLHYHNHSWEFADNGLIFYMIAEQCPNVSFALDTGWAAVSGFDPEALIRKYPGRFHYIHLRDLRKPEAPKELSFHQAHTGFAELGSADMGYPRLMTCLNEYLGPEDWAVVEYELGNFDYLSYMKAISYLRGIQDALRYGKEGGLI